MDEIATHILEKFSDFLEITNPISYMLRWIGWVIIKGLAWLVDSLENVTDSILLIKDFYNYTDVEGLVDMLLPLCGTLMGLSFLYTGYQIIFQKKVDREGIIVNMFMVFVVLALLGEGMDKANQFTDDAVSVLEEQSDGSTAEKIVKDNITDVAQFDGTGWKTTEPEHPNRIPTSSILKIDITQSIDKDFKFDSGKELSDEGKEVLGSKIAYGDTGNPKIAELDGGWFKYDEKYYQYHVSWVTVIVTLAITGFTLLTIAIKLAKLFFEMTFNYVLATIIAPADIHSGQKTKQVIQSILNTFLVTIMVFLSMKIYILGTDFIDAKLDGVAYLIALFAFSLAVIDGPNIVERLFGIDAGLKSGWGAIAGGYALAKGAAGATKGTANTLKGLSSEGKSAALKGVSGIAGVAGIAQGLRAKGQDQSKEETSNGSENGHSADFKVQDQNQEKQSLNGSEGSGEIETGTQEVASSIEQEMAQQQQQEGQTGKGKVVGLHHQMDLNSVSSNKKRSAAANNSPHSISSGSLTKVGNSDLQKNETGDIHPLSSSSPAQSNYPSISEEMQLDSNSVSSELPSQVNNGDFQRSEEISSGFNEASNSPVSFSQSNNSSVSSEMQQESNNIMPLQEKRTDRETRHIGSIISDNVRNSQSVKTVKRTYQIGQNTGESLRENIAKFRRKGQ
ncbi:MULTISPECIES: pLS20_p028 family conjugation system transmembrane protein [unclassified Peribacillus]|uniref:pLS20_p028 family conjugation system transmembrane protein n=1 Tax=unclassified Peribacillus TaxID=2675266 RepID=UPI001F4D9EFC|nr:MULTISPECIES: hypothetical protein [unclassified Peribacillus]MCK1985998.1 hypothetical protein [Peribacillus sp. Aquil_B1]MCK2011221.1 hypothetical protein [Peribacillus sp. Aquil_B8]